ncbi:MAG: SUMF1/EgtB/PvdO family nonheme iron enzyme, partial [Nitrospirota bacterium]
MGSKPSPDAGLLESGIDEAPQQKIFLKGFYIDQYEATVAQYRQFVTATGHRPPSMWGEDYRRPEDNHPVIDLAWADADAYCRWAGGRMAPPAARGKAPRGAQGR